MFTNTIFSGSGDDKLVTPDVYSMSGVERLNHVFQSAKAGASKIGTNILANQNLLADLADIVVSGPGQYSRQEMINRLTWVLGPAAREVVGGLGGTMADTLFATLGVPPDKAKAFKVTLGSEAERIIYYNNYDDPQQAIGILQRVLGDGALASMLDLEAEAALLTTAINASMEVGLYEALDEIKRVDSISTYAWERALWDSTPSIIQSANLDAIERLLAEQSGKNVLGKVPTAIATILQNYRLPDGITASGRPAERLKLVTVLTLIDPVWDRYDRTKGVVEPSEDEDVPENDPTVCVRFDVFSGIGESAAGLLQEIPLYQPAILLANRFQPMSLQQAAKELYPQLAI